MDSNLTFSLLKLYDCFLAPYRPREVSHYILYKIKIIFKLNYKLKFKKKQHTHKHLKYYHCKKRENP